MSVNYPLKAQGRVLKLSFTAIGCPNSEPHAICFTDEPVTSFPLSDIATEVESSPIFPQKTNFEIARVNSAGTIEARIWERGVGETPNSGKGAAAVAVASWIMGYTGDNVEILLPGGEVTVEWDGKGEIYVTGHSEPSSSENNIAPIVTSKSKMRITERTPAPLSSNIRQRSTFEIKELRPETKLIKPNQTSRIVDGWQLPESDILDYTQETEYAAADNQERARNIEEALLSYGVEAKVVQINSGPTVTQFGVEPGWDRKFKNLKKKDKDGHIIGEPVEISRTRVKVDRISSLANDLALALAAPSIRIEAPIPGKSMVGIEVPNTSLGIVSLRKVIESSQFQKLKTKGLYRPRAGQRRGW